MKTRTTIWIFIALVATLIQAPAAAEPAAAGFKVIVHADNPTTSLSLRDLSGLFLKDKVEWSHGVAVEPLDQSGDAEVRAAFSRAVHGRSVSEVKSQLRSQAVERKLMPPLELAGDAAVIAYVQASPGAIGYVSPSAELGDEVKVLHVVD